MLLAPTPGPAPGPHICKGTRGTDSLELGMFGPGDNFIPSGINLGRGGLSPAARCLHLEATPLPRKSPFPARHAPRTTHSSLGGAGAGEVS